MAFSKQTEGMIADKNQFFMQLHNQQFKTTLDIERKAESVEYSKILENHKILETEFTQMFALLQKHKDENNRAFWIYCYYCATLLENFYKAYSNYGKQADYSEIKQQIKKQLLKQKEDKKNEDEFIDSLKNSFIKGFRNLAKAPAHLSQIRDYVAYLNLCRVYWVFCRLTLTSGFALAKELQILEKLDAILGTHTDADKIIDFIKAPNGLLNYFSVGLFLMRFAIDFGLLIRHTFFPSELGEGKNTPEEIWARFKNELYKRHCNFANDLVWATVNFITNFNHITHISDFTAGITTAVFLGFDVCMALYKCHLAKQEYLAQKEYYEKQLRKLDEHPENFSGMDIELHKTMLLRQIKEAEIDWQTKQATFYFNASAAALLMLGFSASLFLTGPGIPVACFFVCTIAVAMYLSSGAFSTYEEKSLRLEEAKRTGLGVDIALKEYEAARNDFIFTMIKNTVMPTLLIATFAVCWPAAVALSVMYMGYEIYHAYDQHNSKKQAQLAALVAPTEEKIEDDYDEIDESNCCVM
ncbi:hypothetical protein [Fluoribacter dumoffii]|uniref:hypothetical protein n=1 Tax=Fluoribacter dumoffii TaxID=463 RepID=UPI00026C7697|nr:hypothetical protein [Fluoribacter dumoffii]